LKPVTLARAKRALDAGLGRFGWQLVRAAEPLPSTDRFDARFHDSRVPLPAGAAEYLRADHPRLVELRASYNALDWPVCRHSRWDAEAVRSWLNLRWFRGENLVVWHYRRDVQQARLLYLLYLDYVLGRDPLGLVERLGEDGAFGCWTFSFPGRPPCSRDLLDAVNELYFLDRQLSLLGSRGMRVLDIGAGYGRLAHRAAGAAPGLAEWCCVDAIPELTFLSEYYLKYRSVVPPARVVALPDVPGLESGAFDLAVNIHSFSEMPLVAIEWWMDQLDRLAVPHFFLVPNEAEGFLSTEADGRRLDYGPAISARGYRLVHEEPAFADPAVSDATGLHDRLCLFERGSA
jgi:SAM-dependent methyltransferase